MAEIDEEDLQFETALADRRHKELTSALRGIASTLNQKNGDNGVAKALEKNVGVIQAVADKLAEIGKIEIPKSPDVNVQLNPKEIVSSVEQLGRDLLVELKKFNDRPVIDKYVWKFTRGQWTQLIESSSATAIYKK